MNKIEVIFTAKYQWFDKNTIKLAIMWRCPECGNFVERFPKAILWDDPATNESHIRTEMDKTWRCDDCLTPEAKRRRLLMKRFERLDDD